MFLPSRRQVLRALSSSAVVAPLSRMHAQQQSGSVLVVDVDETLLDIAALGPQFVRVFGRADVLQEWFSTVVLYSHVTTITGPYVDFGTVARGALEMTA